MIFGEIEACPILAHLQDPAALPTPSDATDEHGSHCKHPPGETYTHNTQPLNEQCSPKPSRIRVLPISRPLATLPPSPSPHLPIHAIDVRRGALHQLFVHQIPAPLPRHMTPVHPLYCQRLGVQETQVFHTFLERQVTSTTHR